MCRAARTTATEGKSNIHAKNYILPIFSGQGCGKAFGRKVNTEDGIIWL
jgi:hypothetical protein